MIRTSMLFVVGGIAGGVCKKNHGKNPKASVVVSSVGGGGCVWL